MDELRGSLLVAETIGLVHTTNDDIATLLALIRYSVDKTSA